MDVARGRVLLLDAAEGLLADRRDARRDRARQLEGSAAATVFSVHQSLRAGKSTPLRVRLTSAGRALLRDPSRVPVVTAALRFGRASLRARIVPRLLPSISSVEFRGKPADPTIVVRGRALAPLPAKSPSGSPAGHDGCPAESGVYGSDYGALFNLNDLTKGWSAGMSFPALHNTACIGIVPTKATPGEVDFRLGAFYTKLYPKFSLDPGDQVQLVLNGAVRDARVAYGGAYTERPQRSKLRAG